MVGALERLPVSRALRDRVEAVAADVEVGAETLLLVADDDDRDARDLGRDVVADVRELLLDADVVPHRPEYRLLLELVQRRVVVELGGKRVTRIEAAADRGGVQTESGQHLARADRRNGTHRARTIEQREARR